MFYNKVEVKAISLALYNMESLGVNGREILLKSIAYLRESYEFTKEDIYLKKAIWHIYAYLELGYPFESGEQEFNKVLEYLHQDVEEIFPKRDWQYKKVSLTKTNVNQILGKWNPYFQSMKINDVILDIIDKVKNKECGKYLYHCGKVIDQSGEDQLWEKTFVLWISEMEAVLQDVNKSRYYMLGES